VGPSDGLNVKNAALLLIDHQVGLMEVQVIGRKFVYDFGPNAIYELHFVDPKHLEVTVVADDSYPKGILTNSIST
jgi:hypothetical protein